MFASRYAGFKRGEIGGRGSKQVAKNGDLLTADQAAKEFGVARGSVNEAKQVRRQRDVVTKNSDHPLSEAEVAKEFGVARASVTEAKAIRRAN